MAPRQRVGQPTFYQISQHCGTIVDACGPGGKVVSNTGLSEVSSSPTPMVIGPDGKPITMADLPPPNTKRWVVRRKAVVVFAVRAGLLSLEAACERYSLSIEEFMSWQRLIESHGMRIMRTTRLKQYRNSRPRRRN